MPTAERAKAGGGGVSGPEAQPAEKREGSGTTAGISELRGGASWALTQTSEEGMLPLPWGQSFV